jgi:drug/metabolite transporter superfamily protein YnfA
MAQTTKSLPIEHHPQYHYDLPCTRSRKRQLCGIERTIITLIDGTYNISCGPNISRSKYTGNLESKEVARRTESNINLYIFALHCAFAIVTCYTLARWWLVISPSTLIAVHMWSLTSDGLMAKTQRNCQIGRVLASTTVCMVQSCVECNMGDFHEVLLSMFCVLHR